MIRITALRIIAVAAAALLVGCHAGQNNNSGNGNTDPVALPDVATVTTNSTNNLVNVLANDSDPNGDGLQITSASVSVTVPAGQPGTVSIQSRGSLLSFTPPTDFSGTQTLTYTISDGHGGTATSVVAITVAPVGLPPAAVPDVYTVTTDSSGNLFDVLANDVDGAGGGLHLVSVDPVVTVPAGSAGSASISGDQISYTPAAGFLGTETLTYTMADTNGVTSTAAVIVTVLPLATPPIASPDVFTVAADSTANPLDVLANDIDLSGSGLTITAVSSISSLPPGSTGSFSISGSQVVYTPAAGFVGVESAQYTITTGDGATAIGAIAIVVGAPSVAVPPVAVPDVYTVSTDSSGNTLDVLANDVDTAMGGLTLTAASSTATIPAGSPGTLSIVGNAIQYTPAPGFTGAETLSYTITDANGTTATGAVAITVLPVDTPPVATPDTFTVTQDTTNNPLDVLANDIDLSGSGLTITAVTPLTTVPVGSTGSFSISGGQIVYTPAAGFVGVETATYEITTGAGQTATGTISIVVSPIAVAVPPVPVPDVVTVAQDSGTTLIDVTANDVDPSGNGLTLTDVTQALSVPTATHGVSISGNQVAFTPAAGFAGVVTLTYTVSDGASTAMGAVAITVTPAGVALPPVAVPDVETVDQDSGATLFNVLGNDISPTGAPLTLTSVSTLASVPVATHSVSISGNQVSFTPAAGFAGVVTLTYTLSDGTNTATGAVAITVSPLPLPALPLGVPDVNIATSLTATPQSYDVLANDIDPSGGGLTLTGASITLAVPLTAGSVSVASNQVVYTPVALYTGVVTITYTAQDSNGQALTGVLTLTVAPL